MRAAAVLEALTPEDIRGEVCRRSFRRFVQQAWPIVESRPFVPNWHIDLLCDALESVSRGDIRNLLINIPPGTGKSLLVSVLWPAWEWATDPTRRFLTASYGQDLATRDAVKSRILVESPWYQRVYGVQLRDDQNAKTRYNTTRGGWRVATSVGGRGTGEHPDRIIIDDPHTAQGALSVAERTAVVDWWKQTISTRGHSRGASQVIVMQRLHALDLAGAVLASEVASEWGWLCLPMRAETPTIITTAERMPGDPRQAGDLLYPDLFPEASVARLERALGSYGAAGQLQQRPAPLEGSILKRQWVRYYRTTPDIERIVISCDPALKDKAQNDPASVQTWGVSGADRYLLARDSGRWDLVELIRQLDARHRWAREQYPGAALSLLIEKTAAGPDAIAALRHRVTGVVGTTPKGDKVQRAMATQPLLEAGNVYLPGELDASGDRYDPARTPGWVQEIVTQWASFPNGAHDDDVDAFTQAMLYLQRHGAPAQIARIDAYL